MAFTKTALPNRSFQVFARHDEIIQSLPEWIDLTWTEETKCLSLVGYEDVEWSPIDCQSMMSQGTHLNSNQLVHSCHSVI